MSTAKEKIKTPQHHKEGSKIRTSQRNENTTGKKGHTLGPKLPQKSSVEVETSNASPTNEDVAEKQKMKSKEKQEMQKEESRQRTATEVQKSTLDEDVPWFDEEEKEDINPAMEDQTRQSRLKDSWDETAQESEEDKNEGYAATTFF